MRLEKGDLFMWFKKIFKSPLLIFIITLGVLGAWVYQSSSIIHWVKYKTKIAESLWMLIDNPNLDPEKRVRIEETARTSQMYLEQEGSFVVNIILVAWLPILLGCLVRYFILLNKKEEVDRPIGNETERERDSLDKFKKNVLLYTVFFILVFVRSFRRSDLEYQAKNINQMTKSLWTLVNEPRLAPAERSHLEEGARQAQYNMDRERPFVVNLNIVLVLSMLLGIAIGSLPPIKTAKHKENKDG
jgi:hypothetical protein